MQITLILAFVLLGAAFASLWISKNAKLWGSLLGTSLALGVAHGLIQPIGLLFIFGLAALWIFYKTQPHWLLFGLLILYSFALIWQLFPGYTNYALTDRFKLGLEKPLIGLFPLALLVPLSRSLQDWKAALKGLGWGCLGIALMMALAYGLGPVKWNPKLPSFALARFATNFFLTAIPEEAFFRGFLQKQLQLKLGNTAALLLTSIIFTIGHVFWSPNFAILGFVFLASLLYGGVYLISDKIESAIATHFLLNFIHMTFFSYHAM